MLEMLKKSVESCPVVKKGNYDYFVHPITDGIPKIEPWMLEEITQRIVEISPPENWDKIVTAEAMGIPIATALSLKTKKPMVIIRKKKYGLEGEVEVVQRTGYSEARMYINGLRGGDRVIFVDDVVSTGGTLIAIMGALQNMGVDVRDIVVVFKKHKNLQEIEEKIGKKIKIMLDVVVEGGKAKAYER